MDTAGEAGQFAPLIRRSCVFLVCAGLLLWHFLSVQHFRRSSASRDVLALKSSFSTPRTIFSGKHAIDYDWNLVHELANQRISHLEVEVWEVKRLPASPLATGCSSLYPSLSPASSCWKNGGVNQGSWRSGNDMKTMKVKVPPGETAMSAMEKRMAEALDQATIDAQTDAISKGLSGSQAQVQAEAHRQRLLLSNPDELLAQQLPTFDLDNFDLQTLFPESLGDVDNSAQLAAFTDLVRKVMERIEAVYDAIQDEDEYEEPSLEEAAADERTIEQAYSNIHKVLPVNLHGHPACPLAPRLAPVPLRLFNTPWHRHPVSWSLLSDSSSSSSGSLGASGSTPLQSSRGSPASDMSEGTVRGDVHDGMLDLSHVGGVPVADAADVWAAANEVQQRIETDFKSAGLPPPDAQNYAKVRLQQVSDLSQRLDAEYYHLFVQRARAKQLLHEKQQSATRERLHSEASADQLSRLMSITRFAMGPVADEHQTVDSLWRDLVHAATLQTRAEACISTGGHAQQCYSQAVTGARPPGYAPLDSLTLPQQKELRGLLGQLFNASVPQPPVRLPVLHWHEEVNYAWPGSKVPAHRTAELTTRLWLEGTGEPRQDAWRIVNAAVASRGTRTRSGLMMDLQAQAVRRYLSLQVDQLLAHIEEWSRMMEPEQLRAIIMEWRQLRRQSELLSHNADKPGVAPTSEELLAQLRSKLFSRTEEGRHDEE